MAPDLTGVHGAGRLPGPTPASTRPVGPSRALVPVGPVSTRTPPSSDPLLGRSGVGLGDVLFTADLLVDRDTVAPTALEVGLEEARTSLLRQQPGDALAALDGVWSTARQSEEGWYLRAGALTVMGLPGEGDRIAGEGLQRQPASLALRLVQSVARLLVGDASGARSALTPALEAAPRDPVLLAQQAVILARQGHVEPAAMLLGQLVAASPEHPAVGWARGLLRAATAEQTRQAARRGTATDPQGHGMRVRDQRDGFGAAALVDEDRVLERVDAPWAEVATASSEGGDVAAEAFRRLGVRLRGATAEDASHEARLLLRAFSTGGTMGNAVSPDQAHAARSVLAALLSLPAPSGLASVDAAPSPLATLLAPLRTRPAGAATPPRGEEVSRLLRRTPGTVPASQQRLVDILLGAAFSDGSAAATDRASDRDSGAHRAIVEGEQESSSPLVPIRLGLALLTESRATRTADAAGWRDDGIGVDRTPWRSSTPATSDTAVLLELDLDRYRTEMAGARAVADGVYGRPAAGRGAGLVAVLCVSAALAAASNGATVIAVALGIGAAWFGLRRSARTRVD